jgi:hypothetical protein
VKSETNSNDPREKAPNPNLEIRNNFKCSKQHKIQNDFKLDADSAFWIFWI